MSDLTAEGVRTVEDVATRHAVSVDAVMTLVHALARGGGHQAQFSHPDLGGMGQWSLGGMTMVGDMFNTWMQAKVDALCTELSGRLANASFFKPEERPSGWQGQSQGSGPGGVSFAFGTSFGGQPWPADLGAPASTGAQNDLRYAVFPHVRRLAIAYPGGMTLYDTGDHQITGASQQQGGGQTLTFTSQNGLVRADDLRVVEALVGDQGRAPSPELHSARPADVEVERPVVPPAEPPAPVTGLGSDPAPHTQRSPTAPAAFARMGPRIGTAPDGVDAVFGALERLAELHKRGVLTDDEFSTKKAGLLSNI